MITPSNPKLVRDLRCSRCGHLPFSTNIHGIPGLACNCRQYTVSLHEWWRQFAIRNRPFPYPDQVPPEALTIGVIAPADQSPDSAQPTREEAGNAPERTVYVRTRCPKCGDPVEHLTWASLRSDLVTVGCWNCGWMTCPAAKPKPPAETLSFEVVPERAMSWKCIECRHVFSGPTNRSPEGGCPKCHSTSVIDINIGPFSPANAPSSLPDHC